MSDNQYNEGETYWHPWRKSDWCAVILGKVGRKFAKAKRVDPITNELISDKTKVNLESLIPRDPSLKGQDNPNGQSAAKPKPSKVKSTPKRPKSKKPISSKELDKMLSYLEDQSTTEDW